jgi:hypothetical protein
MMVDNYNNKDMNCNLYKNKIKNKKIAAQEGKGIPWTPQSKSVPTAQLCDIKQLYYVLSNIKHSTISQISLEEFLRAELWPLHLLLTGAKSRIVA